MSWKKNDRAIYEPMDIRVVLKYEAAPGEWMVEISMPGSLMQGHKFIAPEGALIKEGIDDE